MAQPSKIETRKRPTIAGQAKRASKSTAVLSTKKPASVGYDVGYGRPPHWNSVQTQDERQSKGPAEGNQPQARIDSARNSRPKTCKR